MYFYLVGGTYPEKWWTEFVSWEDEIPNIKSQGYPMGHGSMVTNYR